MQRNALLSVDCTTTRCTAPLPKSTDWLRSNGDDESLSFTTTPNLTAWQHMTLHSTVVMLLLVTVNNILTQNKVAWLNPRSCKSLMRPCATSYYWLTLTDILSLTVSKLSQIILQILDTSPPGGLRATYDVHFRLIGKRVGSIVDLLTELFSLYSWGAKSESRLKIGVAAWTGSVWPKISAHRGVASLTNHSSRRKTRINVLSCGVRIWAQVSFVLSLCTRLTEGQTDTRAYRRTERNSQYRALHDTQSHGTKDGTLRSRLALDDMTSRDFMSSEHVVCGYIRKKKLWGEITRPTRNGLSGMEISPVRPSAFEN